MERNGEPIWDYNLSQGVETGISYGLDLGYVSEFEEREAAVYCNYSPVEFYGLPLEERARCVAQWRLRRLVDNHIEDAVIQAAQRKSRR